MSQDYNRRVDSLRGKRVRITYAWQDGGEARSAWVEGVVTEAIGLGRESFFVLDLGAAAIGASRVVSILEIEGPR